MSLFAGLVKTALLPITIPVAIVADVVTLGIPGPSAVEKVVTDIAKEIDS